MSEAELKRLITVRGTCKSHITRFEKYLDKIERGVSDERVLIELEDKLGQIKLAYDQFNAVQLDIEIHTGAEDNEERETFEDKYFKLSSTAKALAKEINTALHPVRMVSQVSSIHSQGIQNLNTTRLPVIALPNFQGNYEGWLEFRDMFRALVHDNISLSDVQKFQYLRGCMAGKASDILNSLPVTHASYETGWKLLKDRFENIRMIIQNHIAAIFDIAPLKKEAHGALRQLADTITKHLRAIESLGQDTSGWDLLLIHIVVSKLDLNARKHWAEFHIETQLPTYKNITDFLAKRAEVLEQMFPNQSHEQNLSNKDKLRQNFKVAAATYNSNGQTTLSRQVKCVYCSGSHQVYHCEKFINLTNEKKRENIVKLRLCYNCLKPNHSVKDCQSSRCRHCNKKHNSLIHENNSAPSEHASVVANTSNDDLGTNFTSISHLRDCKDNTNSHVLLSTAIVTIRGPNNKYVNAKALLDSGAQACIIREQLVQKIGLQTQECSSRVTGINQSVTLTNINKTACFTIQNSKGEFEIPIKCLVLPNITNRFPKLKMSQSLNIPSNITLADPEFANGGDIEILIGGDIFWSIMGNKRINLHNNEMVLFDSKFGYILAGTLHDTFTENVIFINTCSVNENNLNKQLETFWNIEHIADEVSSHTHTEQICENGFAGSHTRDPMGRFIVKPVKEYELTRVTFGQSATPFLAIRCLHQLAIKNKLSHPRVAHIIETCFYVDDLLCGSDCLNDLETIKRDIIDILKSGGFPLNKWSSNTKSLLDSNTAAGSIQIGESSQNKTLGVYWNPTTDTFHSSVDISAFPTGNTKRAILSTISRFFDPLGYLGPVIIKGKIIIQKLWLNKCSWDETIPLELNEIWIDYKEQLAYINQMHIPRWVLTDHVTEIETHSFSDASENAYGGVIYIRCHLSDGSFITQFVCAKSRVSPVKKVSLPRLELCGALLVAKLFNKINKAMNLHISKTYFWTDSTIALNWIKNTQTQWKTFVANRVSIIQNLTEPNEWYHIESGENPADIISRGMSSQGIQGSRLWRHGPSFLQKPEFMWPLSKFDYNSVEPSECKAIHVTTVMVNFDDFNLFQKHSNLNTMIAVMAYVLRFTHNCRFRADMRIGNLTPDELNQGLNTLIKISQFQSFAKEITILKRKGKVAKKSPLVTLCPFLDDTGLIRVGGRLRKSPYSFSKRHPILLDPKHILTQLIARQEHIRLLHCGAQTLLASIRERYWPVKGKNLMKRITRQCKTCFKFNPGTVQYMMADLPRDRVVPRRAFDHCAADFAGPFQIKDKVTRGYKLVKMYVCIFVCFATKAVHLELVSNLSTEAFLAAFRRFTARRGRCSKIHTDNGTNFLGAFNEIKRLYEFLEKYHSEINNYLGKDRMCWSFSPPKSPHFNGIAESGVRATKNYLKRIIGETRLSQEEFSTVLAQVEACLNSRPISPLSDDPSDLNALTPGHFLVGGPLMALPDKDVIKETINRLSRWQRVQQITQHFWRRWRIEYIHQLQQRFKWNHSTTPVPAIGDLVLLKDNNAPPLQWALGRIAGHLPGEDGTVRVVKVKTVRGLYDRAVKGVCPLPSNERE